MKHWGLPIGTRTGVKPASPRPRGDHGEQLYICDPDGYVIELFARKK